MKENIFNCYLNLTINIRLIRPVSSNSHLCGDCVHLLKLLKKLLIWIVFKHYLWYRSDVHWTKYSRTSSCLFERSHLLIYFNGRLVNDLIRNDFNTLCLLYNLDSISRTPALSVQSVCLSISSMLSSCTEKKRPPGTNHLISS